MVHCMMEGCGKVARSVRSGLCPMHYQRLRTSGRLDLKSAEERFWSMVERGDTLLDCWLWKGRPDANGYARFWVKPRTMLAHRYAYELLYGTIPEGLTLDHRCNVRHCVNPAHLVPETLAENTRNARSANARKTKCPQGHVLDVVNNSGRRECSVCKRDRANRYSRAVKTLTRLDMPTGIRTVEDLAAWLVEHHRSIVEAALE